VSERAREANKALYYIKRKKEEEMETRPHFI
jgi:hypothetical protein